VNDLGPTGLPVFGERYLTVQKLAEGGMAEIFLARDVEAIPPRLVVLKRILPSQAKNPDFLKMFHDEARLASLLVHPNVVKVFELGRGSAGPFMVMEYLAGLDLFEVIRRARRANLFVPWEFAVRVIIEACEGVHAAHALRAPDGSSMNVIHRDLTPSNLFVTWDGGVKVLDFGIAHAERRLAKTRAGTVKGKAQYLAPEQITGDPVDGRVDQFSLGVVLFELLTNTSMFPVDNELAALKSILASGRPAVSELRGGVPAALDDILRLATSLDRGQRFADMRAFANALRTALGDGRRGATRDAIALPLRSLFPAEFDQHATFMGKLALAGTEELRQLAVEAPLELPDEGSTVPTQVMNAEPVRASREQPAPVARAGSVWGWVLVGLVAVGLAGLIVRRVATRPPPPVPMGTLTVRSEPPGATVIIDGQPTAWTTPVVVDTMPLGLHHVRVEHPDRKPLQVDVMVVAGRPFTIDSELPRFTGTLSVRVTPATASVSLDGTPVAMHDGAQQFDDVTAGEPHVLSVEAPGFRSQTRSFETQLDEVTTVEVDLTRAE
jgi:eukaryotic-like serine/threonine-protein kinase